MSSYTFHALWFALLIGCPAFLGECEVPFGEICDFSTFSSYYWLIGLASIVGSLAPKAFLARLESPDGARSRWFDFLCRALFASSAFWFMFSWIGAFQSEWILDYFTCQIFLFKQALMYAWLCLGIVSTLCLILSLRILAHCGDTTTVTTPTQPSAINRTICFSALTVGLLYPYAASVCALIDWRNALFIGVQAMPLPIAMIIVLVPTCCLFTACRFVESVQPRNAPFSFVSAFFYGVILSRALLRLHIEWGFLLMEHTPLVATMELGCLAFVTAAARNMKRHEPDQTPSGANASSDTNIKQSVMLDGLSTREQEAVKHSLEGMTSVEAAEIMGIKASTVRNLQGRAWKKLGYANAAAAREELSTEMAQDNQPNRASNSHELTNRNNDPRWNRASSLALVGIALLMLPWNNQTGSWYTPSNICLFLALGIIGYFVIRAACSNGNTVLPLINPLFIFLLIITLGCCTLLGQIFSQTVLSLSAFAFGFFASYWGDQVVAIKSTDTPPSSISTVATLSIIGFALGLSLYMAWKNTVWSYTFFGGQISLMLIAWSLVGIVALAAHRRYKLALFFTAALAASYLLSAVLHVQSALTVLMAITTLWVIRAASDNPQEALPPAKPIALSCAFGLTIGVGMLDRLSDTAFFQQFMYGPTAAFEIHVPAVFCFGMIACAVVGSSIALWSHLFDLQRLARVAKESHTLPRHRIEGALKAKGLSDLETSVMLHSFEGQICNRIASELNYSVASIYAARQAGCRKLGVRNIEQAFENISLVVAL